MDTFSQRFNKPGNLNNVQKATYGGVPELTFVKRAVEHGYDEETALNVYRFVEVASDNARLHVLDRLDSIIDEDDPGLVSWGAACITAGLGRITPDQLYGLAATGATGSLLLAIWETVAFEETYEDFLTGLTALLNEGVTTGAYLYTSDPDVPAAYGPGHEFEWTFETLIAHHQKYGAEADRDIQRINDLFGSAIESLDYLNELNQQDTSGFDPGLLADVADLAIANVNESINEALQIRPKNVRVNRPNPSSDLDPPAPSR